MILTDDARGIVGHRTRCGTEGMGRRVNTEHGEREAAEQLLMLVELVTGLVRNQTVNRGSEPASSRSRRTLGAHRPHLGNQVTRQTASA